MERLDRLSVATVQSYFNDRLRACDSPAKVQAAGSSSSGTADTDPTRTPSPRCLRTPSPTCRPAPPSAGSLWRGSPCVFTTPVGMPVDTRGRKASSQVDPG